MASEETEKSTVQQAIDQGRNAAEKASQTVQDGYTAAQQYAEDKGLDVGDFVRREPWLAIHSRVRDRLCCGASDPAGLLTGCVFREYLG
jgi:hypothetical protein